MLLTVSDTGTGIPKDILPKIFDPFFTTKETGKGTGLGLATVRSITKSHGGFLTVHSEPGKGTLFSVYLPAQPTDQPQAVAESKARLPLGGGELVLVVDDEASVRTITQATLEAHGYRVMSASDGTEALGVFVRQPEEFKIVLTDVNMPFLDGPTLVRALLRLKPHLKLVVMTGSDEDARLMETVCARPIQWLHKPFNTEQLLLTLRAALNQAKP